jgi:hypothetical protein
MVKTKVQITDTGKREREEYIKRMKSIDGKYVSIGVHEDAGQYTEGKNPPSVVQVAFWNEFGTVNIPERSFIRSTVDEGASEIDELREQVVASIEEHTMTEYQALSKVGFTISEMIRNKIKSNIPPANSPATLAEKKQQGVGSETLQWTKLLLRSIGYKVNGVSDTKGESE